ERSPGLRGRPVVYLLPPGFRHAAAQWGIWRAGGMAVPLAVSHPPPELEHVLDDARPALALVGAETGEGLRPLCRARGIPVREVGAAEGGGGKATDGDRRDEDGSGRAGMPGAALPPVTEEDPALMLYTSGTTGRPKGVVHTHRSLRAQIESLTEAWGWRADDRILLVLPLHHVHGIVNVLSCALWSGARCDVRPGFDPRETWERFARGDLTLFMAVPTIYHRLIAAWEGADPESRERWSAGARTMRLMVSGSAALPVRVLERWRELTGHTLLERYGMTEIGMALSNPLEGERRPGHVGAPLPGVEVRLVDEEERPVEPGKEGEIQVRGPTLFREYWRRPEATAEAFTEEGWFRTGDVAVVEEGHYRILGRKSVDIIKTGGYKVSALEVEEVLRTHPSVDECAVVGVPDPEWGERVAAAVVLRNGAEAGALDADVLRSWAKERLAPYKAPTRVRTVEALPRNAMGKVTKPRVTELFDEVP
ncbi:MAG: AMP-binding protein, partial [Gemmatimonadetes bacterium]|nr:AMP-binding protein [Gemmatimonadota bacterium]NIR77818.1 AMP-binding protein [Gemmatimonadota bacterium]NIT86357.1 AMP-binding protein [Gemmatimonadota bacterium]NIU30191.1 AMP-binding protein [Gemmatimonadota bacterium]NIU35108.1 AMP-binding protein [Gemmatimonadota bacterium]